LTQFPHNIAGQTQTDCACIVVQFVIAQKLVFVALLPKKNAVVVIDDDDQQIQGACDHLVSSESLQISVNVLTVPLTSEGRSGLSTFFIEFLDLSQSH
jgi:hypothetical protein